VKLYATYKFRHQVINQDHYYHQQGQKKSRPQGAQEGHNHHYAGRCATEVKVSGVICQ
jgi:hypothetical protein